jgi:hypothetical protein
LAAVPVLAAVSVEYLLAPEGWALVLLAVVTAIASVGLAGMALWRMQRRPDDRHVARFIEERANPPLDDALVSAVDLIEQPDNDAAGFAPMIVANAVKRLRQIDPSHVIPARAVRRAIAQAAGGLALLALGLSLGAPPLSRAVDTARVRLFPGSILVEVLPGDARVPAGSPLRIRAVIRVGSGAVSRFPPSLTVSAGEEERTVRMSPTGDGFEFPFESVDRTFTYRVSAGSAVSSDYTVTALFPPRVEQIDLRYAYPAFTGLAVREEEDGGDIYAPVGTRVRVRIRTDKPIAAGQLAMARAGGAPLALRQAGERLLEGELILKQDDSYRVALADSDGLRSAGDTEYFIRLMDDRPPDVRILRPSADQSITPLEEVSIEARADDDYGIARFDLVYSVAGGREHVVPFHRISGTDIQKVGSRLMAAEDLGVKPGDVIAYYARARDVGRGKRSTETQSDIFFLEVKPFSEEFVAAQSQAGGSGASSQIDSLVAAQKEIISATWNIERRSSRGVSAEDLKQVAAAQAELRQRVEQMASRSNRGRIRPPAPERTAPQLPSPQGRRPAADPIAAALEAMVKAQQQLDAQKTKDALPHEMAALNGLLAAQAEVRRREVSRQANSGGGGGSNRSGQDLSALFDKELQRQQRTNYESRSQIEERPDRSQANETAADRIRDLARRQEDLSRQQREAANAGLSPEEMKRQLERLTREQIELRERAEELNRQMSQQAQQGSRSQQQGQQGQAQGQPQGQPQGGSQGQSQEQAKPGAQPGGGGSGMRDAAEQMRNAASDLRREDPNAAAQSSEKAAEQLRRLEQQMRDRNAGAQQKAAGELQLEAQQIAQEQRRIAAEAERLDKSQGGATAEARRRLADEKERLAGRVDELQRAARQEARRDPKGAGAGPMGAAAKELESQQLGQRMRESAKGMRAAADGEPGKEGPGPTDGKDKPAAAPKNTAGAEQQIARALDRIVDTLGGGASADARRLSDQLDQTREIRERLNRLEQQMREAEARQRAAGQPGQQAGRSGREGAQGQQGSRGSSGEGQGGELQKLQQEYQRELQRARDAVRQLTDAPPQSGAGTSTPEEHEFSRSAPGTEASKQDRSGWESLRKNVDSALERYEASVSQRLARKLSADTLSAGGSDRVPESYRRQIARYYESLARVKK